MLSLFRFYVLVIVRINTYTIMLTLTAFVMIEWQQYPIERANKLRGGAGPLKSDCLSVDLRKPRVYYYLTMC